ncbi:MAG: cob(I)yrinic acid a,c-diamide adenosyltransferase [Bacteroidales bacterium]|jgi:cob(I)alamin adenosyltransferase|nr:cob(I)yrinic acid a,c-diamide adenosyltransferase [Bacteroidales bacterium]
MKIYTRTGDKGFTGLIGNSRIHKSDSLIEAYGTLDELNAFIGCVLAKMKNDTLERIQVELFILGGLLATPVNDWEKRWGDHSLARQIAELETDIDRLSATLLPPRGFILPRGHEVIALLHVCRTVCRRTERVMATLVLQNEKYLYILQYLNRLSDYFYVLVRHSHQENSIEEIYVNIK